LRFSFTLWAKVVIARALIRVIAMYGDPLWILVNVGGPLLTSTALAFLYRFAGLPQFTGFAILGGGIAAYWGNVLWSMASQLSWDKRSGMLYLYITSPAPLTALLIGMSLGGILGTLPSSIAVLITGTLLFKPPFSPPTITLVLIFMLTLVALYGMGIALSSLYLFLSREAEEINEALYEPVSFLSGIYFPSIGRSSPLPIAIQAVAALIPLTIGMDSLRRTVFYAEGLSELWPNIALLAAMAVTSIYIGLKMLSYIERRGRETGDILVTLK